MLNLVLHCVANTAGRSLEPQQKKLPGEDSAAPPERIMAVGPLHSYELKTLRLNGQHASTYRLSCVELQLCGKTLVKTNLGHQSFSVNWPAAP